MIQIFIISMVFVLIGIPVLSAIAETLVAWINVFTTKAYEIAAKINYNISKYDTESEECHQTLPIGFAAPLTDSEEEYDE